MRGGARVADSGVQARPFRTPSHIFVGCRCAPSWPLRTPLRIALWRTRILLSIQQFVRLSASSDSIRTYVLFRRAM